MIKTLKISGVTKADLTTSNNRERYAWVKNNTGGNVYASVLDSTCTAGADNVAEIAAGDVRMIDTLSLGYLWISGNGSVEIQLSDSENCPFKLSQKGGDISASGGVVQLGGLQGGVPFSEVTVKGKNLIPYPYTWGLPYTNEGITWAENPDNSISTSGNYNGNFSRYKFASQTLLDIPYGTLVTFSGIPNDYSDNDIRMTIVVHDESGNSIFTKSLIPSDPTVTFEWFGKSFSILADVMSQDGIGAVFKPMLELGDTATEYAPPITGQELTITVNDTAYIITPDSNPYTVPTEIYQQDGINTVYVTGEGEPTLSVKGVKTNAAVKRIWDKLNELTTAIIVSNGEI